MLLLRSLFGVVDLVAISDVLTRFGLELAVLLVVPLSRTVIVAPSLCGGEWGTEVETEEEDADVVDNGTTEYK